jgi:hypothetical protein
MSNCEQIRATLDDRIQRLRNKLPRVLCRQRSGIWMKRRCPEWMTKVALPRYREPVPYGEALFGSRIFPEPLSKTPLQQLALRAVTKVCPVAEATVPSSVSSFGVCPDVALS